MEHHRINVSTIRKSLKQRVEWILSGGLQKSIELQEYLFYYTFLEYCKASFGTPEEEYEKKYKRFLNSYFGSRSCFDLTTYIKSEIPERSSNEYCLKVLNHFFNEVCQSEFLRIQGGGQTKAKKTLKLPSPIIKKKTQFFKQNDAKPIDKNKTLPIEEKLNQKHFKQRITRRLPRK